MYVPFVIIFFAVLIVYAYFTNKYWNLKLSEKKKQIEDAEAQLIQMEKMASLGTLAAGVAHEINNPLGFLISNLESLKDCMRALAEQQSSSGPDNKAAAEDIKAMIQESLEGSLRIKKIVQDLRTFARRSESQKTAVDINQILETTLSILWNEIKYKITVIKDYQVKSAIFADTTQLSQVFLNILLNASQAISDKGTVSLYTYEDENSVYVKFCDTGSGISPDVLPRIFDPFFSTKKGTGLGLSVSYNIIKHHGGSIEVKSQVGSGTTFIIRLPKDGQV